MTQQIPIDLLDPHPQNPRLILREDVIAGIAAQLQEQGEFDPAHALLVRPLDGRYQIIRGHHRIIAAQQAGLETVPCWVREMGDDEAYMQLALGNVQGELSPLEIGIHALGAIELSEGGRGIEGGIREYSRQLGYKNHAGIVRYRQGAEVLQSIKTGDLNHQFIKCADHLAAIYSLPQELWSRLAQWLITPNDQGKTPSANQTQELVKSLGKFDIPDDYKDIYPLLRLTESYLDSQKPTPDEITKLISLVRTTEAIIKSHTEKLDYTLFPYTVDEFREWLLGGVETYSWTYAEVDRYQSNVVKAAQDATKPPKPDVKPGEWYKLGDHLLYCGDTSKPEFWQDLPQVKFAFADPPYNAGVDDWDKDFKWAHDWLIEKAPTVAVTPGIESIQSFFKNDTNMPYAWSISIWLNNGMTRSKLGFGNWIYVALFATDSIYQQSQDFIQVSIKTSQTKKDDHKGRKPPEMMQKLITLFTDLGDKIIDPFLGSGTTLFEANQLGRVCIGGEIRPDFCNSIIEQWQNDTGQAAQRINDEDAVQ